jgi:signal transduction histidine kinase
VSASAPFPIEFRSSFSRRNGFTESGSERMLRDWLLLASAFTGAFTAVLLRDDTGIWYRDSSGLTTEQLADLESILAPRISPAANVRLLQGSELQVIEALPLLDINQHAIGTLCVLGPGSLALSACHRKGLELVAGHIQTVLTTDQQHLEMRTIPRAPSAASFVPGLVHELRNFMFGISANLDAFDARFVDQEEVSKYGVTLRKGLDRLSAFVAELRAFADPQTPSWTERPLEPLLREAFEHLKPLAERNQVELKLHCEGVLPALCMDEPSLCAAFIHLISLALQQEAPGGRTDLHLAARRHGERAVICGHLDGAGLKLKEVDLARLFEPFYFRGSGLGRLALPVARRVFEAHGGNLTAGPGPEGGMRINFMLPAARTYP